MASRPRLIGDREVTCLACGWVAYAMSFAEARSQVEQMTVYLETLPPETRKSCGEGGPSLSNYVCRECGGCDFRPARQEDCPDGVTTNPVIWEGWSTAEDSPTTPSTTGRS